MAAKKKAGRIRGGVNRKRPLTIEELKAALSHWEHLADAHPHKAHMYMRNSIWLILSFYGLLRRRESLELRWKDLIARRADSALHMYIKHSNCDQWYEGQTVVISLQPDQLEADLHSMLGKLWTAQGQPNLKCKVFTRWDTRAKRLTQEAFSADSSALIDALKAAVVASSGGQNKAASQLGGHSL